jgi:tetratricopeptide (TPR) repeat protein
LSDPLVSLCMIVRDEEAVLERCLRSVSEYVDEMVVVDTGSSDRTREIAATLGARVIERAWEGDFSAARNEALAEAAGMFVLVLDADEWIESGPDPGRFAQMLRATGREAFTVEIADRQDGGGVHRYPLVRLFRNRQQHRYSGAFHEQITPSIARTLGVELVPGEPSGLTVGHDGYVEQRRIDRGKAERNLGLLRSMVEKNPGDAPARYFLARESIPFRGGRAVPGSHLHEAVRLLESIEPGALAPALAVDAARLQAAALLALERPAVALEVLDRDGDRGAGCELLRADAEIAQAGDDPKRLGDALKRILRCFDRESRDLGPYSDPSLAGPVARARAAEVLLRLGRPAEARRLAEEGCLLPGGGATASIALAAVCRAEGDLQGALQAYLRGLESDQVDPWAWAGMGTMLLEAGDGANAAGPLRNAVKLAPGWNAAEEALAEALRAAQGGDPG